MTAPDFSPAGLKALAESRGAEYIETTRTVFGTTIIDHELRVPGRGPELTSSFSDYQADQERRRVIGVLRSLPLTPTKLRNGVNDSPRVPCARKPDTHGFHPKNERCPYCP